jgi:hypothetical protein
MQPKATTPDVLQSSNSTEAKSQNRSVLQTAAAIALPQTLPHHQP